MDDLTEINEYIFEKFVLLVNRGFTLFDQQSVEEKLHKLASVSISEEAKLYLSGELSYEEAVGMYMNFINEIREEERNSFYHILNTIRENCEMKIIKLLLTRKEMTDVFLDILSDSIPNEPPSLKYFNVFPTKDFTIKNLKDEDLEDVRNGKGTMANLLVECVEIAIKGLLDVYTEKK